MARFGRSKYRAVKTVVDGITFASKGEAGRYRELVLLEMAGKIRFLELQPSYVLKVEGVKVCVYKADFKYFDVEKGIHIVEDFKGMLTPVYRLKKKLLLALYPEINFLETHR